jgi:hypothetical protein
MLLLPTAELELNDHEIDQELVAADIYGQYVVVRCAGHAARGVKEGGHWENLSLAAHIA